jgi:hypothetical protein
VIVKNGHRFSVANSNFIRKDHVQMIDPAPAIFTPFGNDVIGQPSASPGGQHD